MLKLHNFLTPFLLDFYHFLLLRNKPAKNKITLVKLSYHFQFT